MISWSTYTEGTRKGYRQTFTLRKPCSRMKPKIIGTAVKTPIWKRNCVFKAALRAVFFMIFALNSISSSRPDNAWEKIILD